MLLIKLAPVILLGNGYVGLNSNKFVLPVSYSLLLQKKMAFIIHFIFSPNVEASRFPELTRYRGITFSVLEEILHSFLKEFSPRQPPSPAPPLGTMSVFLCCAMFSLFVHQATRRDITTDFPKHVD